MNTESLFTKCRHCGKAVSKAVKECQHCGAKLKRMTSLHLLGIIFCGFLVIAFIGALDESPQTAPSTQNASKSQPKLVVLPPEGQSAFIDAVTIYIEEFKTAKNELQQSAMRNRRKEDIAEALQNYTVKSWVGVINDLSTNTDGDAVLSIRISPDIEIKTWNNAFSDIAANSLIDVGSPLYEKLFNLENGQQVKFSGSFYPSKTDYIEETSVTIDGAMQNPEFLFKFNDVTPIK